MTTTVRGQQGRGLRFPWRALAVACVGVLGSSAAMAADKVWFGGAGVWSDPMSWVSAGVPGDADHAIITSGAVVLEGRDHDWTVGALSLSGGRLVDGSFLEILGAARLEGDVAHEFSATGSSARSAVGQFDLVFAGETLWSGNTQAGGNAILASSASSQGVVVFQQHGTWTDGNQFDASMSALGSSEAYFWNTGTYLKTGAGTTRIEAGFLNGGSVQITNGQLRIAPPEWARLAPPISGQFEVDAGASLVFDTGPGISQNGRIQLEGAGFSGTGQLIVDGYKGASLGAGGLVEMVGPVLHAGDFVMAGGNLQVHDSLSVASYRQSGGVVGGTGTLEVQGSAHIGDGWLGMAGGARFHGPLLIQGEGMAIVGSVTTRGDTRWEGNSESLGNGIAMNGASTIRNEGIWTDANAFETYLGIGGAVPVESKRFVNVGTYVKDGAATTRMFAVFDNLGALDLRQGRMELSAPFDNQGLVHVGASATLASTHDEFVNGGTLTGDGQVQNPGKDLLNRGVIAPGDGIGDLLLATSLTMDDAGVLRFELAGSGLHDHLTIGADASFAGSLEIVNLGYLPTIGDRIALIDVSGGMAGSTFARLAVTGFGDDVSFDLIYGEHDVTLAVVAVPEAESWLLMLAGLGLLGARASRRRAAVD